MKRFTIFFLTLGVLLAVAPGEIQAEVAVQTDAKGEYLSTVVVPGGPPWRPGIWSKRLRYGMRHDRSVLNPRGDRFGDLIPSIVETNLPPHRPWAVWSRFNGRDYDLVWSNWQRNWSRIQPVLSNLPVGDDLDPNVAFTRHGWPILTWWNRDDLDRGTVYFSMHLNGRWMDPLEISSSEFGGRNPTIQLKLGGRIEITYDSDDGTRQMTRMVMLLSHPDTITDDIDPQGQFMLSATQVMNK